MIVEAQPAYIVIVHPAQRRNQFLWVFIAFSTISNPIFFTQIIKITHVILREKMVSNFVLSAAPRYDTAIDGRLVLKADQDALKQETHPQVQFSLVP